MIIEEIKWEEYHSNGKLWISGKIGIVGEMWKHLYQTLYGFKGYENLPVCRIGMWTKYFDNGQIAWSIDYGGGTLDYKSLHKYPSYRKDGSLITF